MNYEVMHGEYTHIVQAGNPWAACLDVLRKEAEKNDIQQGPLQVTRLPMGETHHIPMTEALSLQILAINPEEKSKPPVYTGDLTHW